MHKRSRLTDTQNIMVNWYTRDHG